MNDTGDTKERNNKRKESFITIDDLARMAEELLDEIIRMSEYKYPLDVRKGDSFTKEAPSLARINWIVHWPFNDHISKAQQAGGN